MARERRAFGARAAEGQRLESAHDIEVAARHDAAFLETLSSPSEPVLSDSTIVSRALRTAVRTLPLAAALLGGCSFLPTADRVFGPITPYRIEIVQGNVITREQVAAIKPGMSRAQVRDILGSPLLADPFHADRWDYVFTMRRPGTPLQSRAVVVLFENDVLKSVDPGGELPGEREFVAAIDPVRAGKPPDLVLTDEQKKALPVPPRPAPPEAVPDVAARTYPPLESAGP
jgi:outer membrane protein assembly factor BamE